MSEQNVIDTLSIEIEASAKDAVKGLSQLESRLRGLSASLKTVSGAAHSITTLANSLQKIGNVNTGNLTKVVDQFERLSRMDLKDKTVKLNVTLNGATEAERQVKAMDDAMKSVNTNAFAKRINEAFKLSGDEAKKTVEAMNASLKNITEGGTGMTGFFAVMDTLKTSGEIAKSSFDESTTAIKEEYNGLLNYLHKYPIKITTKSEDLGNDKAQRMRYFSQRKGTSIDDRWQEMVRSFPTLLSGLEGVANEEDMVYQLFQRIGEAKARLNESAPIRLLNGGEEEAAWDHIIGFLESEAQRMKSVYSQAFTESMKESQNKVPLDVQITGSQVENKINAAIKEASLKTYSVPIKLSFDTKEFKENLKAIFSGVKVTDFNNIVTGFQGFSQSMQSIGGVDFTKNGLRPFITSLTKLANVKIDASLSTDLPKIATALHTFADVPEVSTKITRLIVALAKLADTGNRMRNATVKLPDFAEAIRKVATTLSQLGGVNPLITQFISSIGQLASSAQKMPDAAKNLETLSESLKKVIESLSKTSVSQDIVKMVSSISQLSTSLGTVNQSTTRSVGNSTQKMSKYIKMLANIIDKVLKQIGTLFKKIGSGIASVAKKVVSNITGINRASKSMFTVSDGIKSVIGGLLGMRGITGVFNWAKEAVTAGGDITEINHIIESVFEEDMVDAVDTWATEAIEKFGIASGAAKHYAGVLSSMFQASGVSMREAGEMSLRLTEMAGDLSAFYNIDTETAYQKIQSGMAGMVRPLRSLGIDLSVASLQEYALSQGITKKVSAMTQAEKVMLRYHYLLQATSQATGDFARTSDKLKTVA